MKTDPSAAKEGMRAVTKPSALPLWGAAAVWLIAALFLPMASVGALLLYAAISVGVYFLIKKVAKPTVTYEPIPEVKTTTGNAELDAKVEEMNRSTEKLAAAAAAIAGSDADVATTLYGIVNTVTAIRDDIISDPSDLPRVKRLLNYYLPTTEKLADTYARLSRVAVDGGNVAETKENVRTSLGVIDETMKKTLDGLFENEALDVATDIEVLDAMLTRDGLTGGMPQQQ